VHCVHQLPTRQVEVTPLDLFNHAPAFSTSSPSFLYLFIHSCSCRAGAKHPFFFGCQYHPEFQSHPHKPSPPFHGFILAASGQLNDEGILPLPATTRVMRSRTSPAGPRTPASSATQSPDRSSAVKGHYAASGPASVVPSTCVSPVKEMSKFGPDSPSRPIRQMDTTSMGPAVKVSDIEPRG